MKVRLLDKATLCIIFGEYSKSSFTYYYTNLRQRYFTDEVLSDLGISIERYRSVIGGNYFTFAESKRIIEYFDITEDELQEFDGQNTSKSNLKSKSCQ